MDKFHDECGVVGIYAPQLEELTQLIYYGLYALQHRGQESAGIAISEGKETHYHKDMGLVAEVFSDKILDQLKGKLGIGHVRYSTTGESLVANAQPLVVKYKEEHFALAHNGNLVNAKAVREMLQEDGVLFQTTIDTEVVANLLARFYKKGLVPAVKQIMDIVKGAYAFVLTAEEKLIGIRDPYGLRPLCLGKIEDKGYVLASESCALDTMGAEFIRDIEPGEIIIIDENGCKSEYYDKSGKKNLCIFELIYFARPDSVIEGISTHSYRYKLGRLLAQEAPVEVDHVIAVPDSGVPAAIGFAAETNASYAVGLIKNRYIGRTFIQPTQKLRERGVRIKLNVLKKIVTGKSIVLVDDSIVRGTTSKWIVDMLRKAGAKEIHLRITSPPVAYPCHFGIDTPSRDQLIGANMSVEEIREMLGADSLAYLSNDAILKATNCEKGFCRACFDGDYPMEVPKDGNKFSCNK